MVIIASVVDVDVALMQCLNCQIPLVRTSSKLVVKRASDAPKGSQGRPPPGPGQVHPEGRAT